MADPPSAGPHGFVVVDKPAGWTSHDVVAKSRGVLGTRKVGHSGTLDPMATGVLVLGVGRGTRLLRYLSGLDKTYEAVITLGVETDSLDADGAVVARHDMDPPRLETVQAAAAALSGELMQVPPMVSAVKVGGRRLHELARQGKEVHREPRAVTVHRFAVSATGDPMRFAAVIDCSSGTFVRVLAAELGAALGGGAHLSGLRRSAVGPFTLAEARPLEDPELVALSELTRVVAPVEVDDATSALVGNGRVLERSELHLDETDAGPWALLDHAGALLAVYEPHRGGSVKPAVVIGQG